LAARNDRDSVGGVIECAVLGLPAGMGAPDYGENVEGIFSQQLFAVPGVKAVGFGDGFGFAALRGSEANDALYMRNGEVVSPTNHSGGVNGGITNGLPILFEVALRPTASIAQEQDTVNLDSWTDSKLIIQGRHDPCIVHRAVPVIEAAAALAVCQLMGI
ncbi:MAG: chorismate synthase, partial [Evtepia sp.]